MFVQYLAEQGLKMTYGDRKQRKTMQYKDLATAVARVENLEFLADVIPPTVPYKQVRERKNNKTAKDTETGQLTLNGQRILPIGSSNGRKKSSAESDTIAVASGRERGVNGDKGNEIEMS
jgi:hypothetical protein